MEPYNLAEDVGETNDLSETMPEKVKELSTKLEHCLVEVGTIRHTMNPEYLATE